MVADRDQPFIPPEAYLEAEAQSPTKHEYMNGLVYAMAGASDAHVTIAGNLFAFLRSYLRGTGCRVYIADMKVRIESLNTFYYPDVMVTCDPRDHETPLFKRYPCFIVEVLSDSTEAFDRGDKFADYQHLDSLQEYVLISTQRQRVDSFRKNEEGLWVLRSFLPGSKVDLASIQAEIAFELLYEDVTLAV